MMQQNIIEMIITPIYYVFYPIFFVLMVVLGIYIVGSWTINLYECITHLKKLRSGGD